MITLFVILCLSHLFFCQAYLPGVAPRGYERNEAIPLKVNSLTSSHTQMPYKYYSLAFCVPEKIEDSAENIGEILNGDRIENSPYLIQAGVDVACKLLCKQKVSPKELKHFSDRIEEDYRVQWLLDLLPAATKKLTIDATGKTGVVYESGFPLGRKGKEIIGGEEGKVYINNHVFIRILYNEDEMTDKLRIIGFEVEPESIQYSSDAVTCRRNPGDGTPPQSVSLTTETDIRFSYSIKWEPTDTKWTSRWDIYLLMTDNQIHWFSIINSLMIVLFLTGMVAMIMMRTLNADLKRYRELEQSQDEPPEETGWKLVHGDVFRPPSCPMLLSVLVGTGVQVFSMSVITMIFAVLGFLSPANRGGLMTAMVVLFVIMGIFAGYFSARLYKFFKGQYWKKNVLLTAVLFPGTIFSIFLCLDIVLAVKGSSGAVPFGTLIALIALWFGISVPLVFFGSYFGFKKDAEEIKVRTNQIPRQIPEQVWYMNPLFSVLMGGILPFGAVFIELFFILSSIWLHQFYYIFGFLAIVFIILILTCAEITIVMCYFQLCSEDYHWWWRSYLTSGASAFYMFLYSVFYFFTKLQITQFVPILLYFGYTIIMTLFFFVLTGAIGFYACFFFVKTIYSAIKLE